MDNAQPFARSAVLTVAEEAAIVEASKDLNCHGQGIGRKELGQEPCKKLVSAARQHTSLDACVDLDGYLYDPHLTISGKHIQRSDRLVPCIFYVKS